ncbi:MAG: RNHCP domain-containing protein [Phycisphaerales bacterium]
MPRPSRERARRDQRKFTSHDDNHSQTPKPRHGRRNESDGFTCVNCGAHVRGVAWGTSQRNHCPNCLHSKHVDERPGDRASPCGGTMEPIAIAVRSDGDDAGEWVVVHRCRRCGALKSNRIAGDDSERALLALALRPLARPAFPIDDLRDG